MARNHRFDNVPSPRLMQTIGATALEPTESVAELVANCLDARIEESAVGVIVEIGAEEISVRDDAAGMDLETLEAATRLGVDMNQVTHRRRRRMGTYGLGMKTAAASLGNTWGIVTRPASEPGKEYRVTFDLASFVNRGATSKDWSLTVFEDVVNTDGLLGDAPHGTVVWVRDLRNDSLMPGPFIDHLGRAFGPYARQFHDTITVNGTLSTDDAVEYVDGSKVELDIVLDEMLGWRVTGWAALDKKTHNKADYGLHLYRSGQLVETWNKSFFKAHLMTSRVMGVLHLDYVPVNFNKKGFVVSSEEWRFTVKRMTEELKPVVEASRTMSRGRGDDTRQHRAVSKMREVLGVGSTSVPAGSETGGTEGPIESPSGSDGGDVPLRRAATTIGTARDRLELPRGHVRIVCDVKALQDVTLPWDYIFADEADELLVLLNPDSTVYGATKDVEFLACLAIGDSIGRYLVEREGLDAGRARRVRDQWLHEAFSSGYTPTRDGASASPASRAIS
jgi:hypothetical protein